MANDRSKTPTLKGTPKAADAYQTDETKYDGPHAKKKRGADSGDDDKTNIYDSGKYPNTPKATLPKPGEPDFVREAATPIKVRSMKTPGASSGEIPLPPEVPRPQHQVKLRAISEIASNQRPQLALGYLAPPRDPNAVRARRWRDFVVWGSVCVILACVVALGIWFIAK
jgi:hypothetical protein